MPIGMCGLLKRDTLPDADVGLRVSAGLLVAGLRFEAASGVMQYGRGSTWTPADRGDYISRQRCLDQAVGKESA